MAPEMATSWAAMHGMITTEKQTGVEDWQCEEMPQPGVYSFFLPRMLFEDAATENVITHISWCWSEVVPHEKGT